METTAINGSMFGEISCCRDTVDLLLLDDTKGLIHFTFAQFEMGLVVIQQVWPRGK